MNAREIEYHVSNYFDVLRNICVPNVSHGFNGLWESDLLIVTKARYLYEVEIKTSVADLRKDLKKNRWVNEFSRRRFDELAELARNNDVYLGCNCPTQRQPDVRHCHTVLALAFLRQHYPDLDVRFP